MTESRQKNIRGNRKERQKKGGVDSESRNEAKAAWRSEPIYRQQELRRPTPLCKKQPAKRLLRSIGVVGSGANGVCQESFRAGESPELASASSRLLFPVFRGAV